MVWSFTPGLGTGKVQGKGRRIATGSGYEALSARERARRRRGEVRTIQDSINI